MPMPNFYVPRWWQKFNIFDVDRGGDGVAPGKTPALRVMHTSDLFLGNFLTLWLFFCITLGIYSHIRAPEGRYIAIIGSFAGIAAQFTLYSGRTVAARWIFILPVVITVATAPWMLNGIRTPVISNMPLLLILTGWMLGRRAMLLVGGGFIVALVSMWAIEALGWWNMPVPLRGPDTWLMVFAFNLTACAIVMAVLIGNYQADMQRESACQERLTTALQFSSLVIDCSPVPIRVFDRIGRCIAVNEAYAQLIGVSRSQLMTESLHDVAMQKTSGLAEDCKRALETGQPLQKEIQAETNNGRSLWLQAHLVPFDSDGQRHLLAHFIDLTERHHFTQELKQLAFHDGLTGLANRRLFFEHLYHAVQQCQRNTQWGAVLMLDLNRFKQLNDQHGHEAGDRLLIEVAHRLRSTIRSTDIAARLGGDEFTLLLYPLGSTEAQAQAHALHLMSKLHDLLAQPYQLGDITHSSSASIGLALIAPDKNVDAEALMRSADAQMYAAKQANAQGRNVLPFSQTPT